MRTFWAVLALFAFSSKALALDARLELTQGRFGILAEEVDSEGTKSRFKPRYELDTHPINTVLYLDLGETRFHVAPLPGLGRAVGYGWKLDEEKIFGVEIAPTFAYQGTIKYGRNYLSAFLDWDMGNLRSLTYLTYGTGWSKSLSSPKSDDSSLNILSRLDWRTPLSDTLDYFMSVRLGAIVSRSSNAGISTRQKAIAADIIFIGLNFKELVKKGGAQ